MVNSLAIFQNIEWCLISNPDLHEKWTTFLQKYRLHCANGSLMNLRCCRLPTPLLFHLPSNLVTTTKRDMRPSLRVDFTLNQTTRAHRGGQTFQPPWFFLTCNSSGQDSHLVSLAPHPVSLATSSKNNGLTYLTFRSGGGQAWLEVTIQHVSWPSTLASRTMRIIFKSPFL